MLVASGNGELFYSDDTPFGAVEYEIEAEQSAYGVGRISGQLWRVDQHEPPWGPFGEITNRDGRAKLRLEDGRWWLCNVAADGEANNAGQGPDGGFYPAGSPPSSR